MVDNVIPFKRKRLKKMRIDKKDAAQFRRIPKDKHKDVIMLSLKKLIEDCAADNVEGYFGIVLRDNEIIVHGSLNLNDNTKFLLKEFFLDMLDKLENHENTPPI
jgi:hypothetical protein